jgi:hypothetical protein
MTFDIKNGKASSSPRASVCYPQNRPVTYIDSQASLFA